MHKFGSDPKVKKTLVRNCEKTVKPSEKKQAFRDFGSTLELKTANPCTSVKGNELNHPSLCSSEALAHYLTEAKISSSSPLTTEDINVNRGRICAKVTKKLNFHFNDRIYRNLIELNENVEDAKKKKDKRSSSSSSIKKDLEPKLEDFYEDIIDEDSCPDIPVIKPKFKPVRKMETGQLHRLVAGFEEL